MKNSTGLGILIASILVIFICCAGLVIASILGITVFSVNQSRGAATEAVSRPNLPFATATQEPGIPRTPDPNPNPSLTPPPVGTPGTSGRRGEETLRQLEEIVVPNADLVELAERLEGKQDVPRTLPGPSAPLTVGTRQNFNVTNVDTNRNFRVDATLAYVTDHLYFWIEDSIQYNPNHVRDLAETFETKIYPTNREFFGSEWSPGVDDDPHLYVLYARGLGSGLAGYFSSADSYSPLAHEYSNGHEMFMLNADNLDLDERFTYNVLAHEFQHMIHWYGDRNEDSWMNEGFSVLAELLNGYPIGGFDYSYAMNPDLQLNDWPNDSSATTPHYGAGFLYLAYFLDRFGEDLTKALVAHPDNGLVSIDRVLEEHGLVDPLTGQTISGDDLFADWVVTNYLLDPNVGDGRYDYSIYPAAPKVNETESLNRCPTGAQERTVNQYGVDYIRIACRGSYTLSFTGSSEVGVLAEDAYSGDYAFWSNKGDESDMTLTQSFDFSGVSGPLTLSFWTWYDLEKDYDYLYLLGRTGEGSWQILTTPSGTDADPSGNSYGWAYNGETSGWIQEQVDISQFAGKEVELRFEYVTDAAVNGEGFLLDDVSIPEIGYFTDFEADEGGWEAAGWVRLQNLLPQTFRLALIKRGAATSVEYLELQEGQTLQVPLDLGGETREVVLVVSGTTRFTRQPARYEFRVDR